MYNFLFRDVNFVDAGDYTCFAENKFGDAKAEGTLTVKGLYFKVLLCVISVGFFLKNFFPKKIHCVSSVVICFLIVIS